MIADRERESYYLAMAEEYEQILALDCYDNSVYEEYR